MIVIKTAREIRQMQDACKLSARALRLAGEAIEPGVSTFEIDTLVRKYIEGQGQPLRSSVMADTLLVLAFLSIMWLSMVYRAKRLF